MRCYQCLLLARQPCIVEVLPAGPLRILPKSKNDEDAVHPMLVKDDLIRRVIAAPGDGEVVLRGKFTLFRFQELGDGLQLSLRNEDRFDR